MDLKWDRRYKRRRAIIWIIVLILLVLNVNLEVSDLASDHGCISVSFDKLPLLLADRIVVCQGDERYEITDRGLVWDVATASRVPVHISHYHDTVRWLEVYCSDFLVRRIRWADGCAGEVFIVYEQDLGHWIFPNGSKGGMVYPSEELLTRLEAACATN